MDIDSTPSESGSNGSAAPAPALLVEGVPSTPSPGAAASPASAAEPEALKSAPAKLEIKRPEGVPDNDAVFQKLEPLAVELGLDSTKAQRVAEFYAETMRAAKAQNEELVSQALKTWNKALQDDKEFGGASLEATRTAAQRAITRFGGKELSDFLSGSGLGSHPEMVRLLARVGSAIKEDTVTGTTGQRAATAAQTEEQFLRKLYPTMFKD